MDKRRTSVGSAVSGAIWGRPLEAMPRWKAVLVGPVRFVYVLVRDLTYGELTLRAMGLVYTTLLSIVPLLALSFSVLKAFGVYNQLDPLLLKFLAPLGAQSVTVSQWIIRFIENLNVGVLGSIGLALLIYTVVSLMQKIEEAFNFIWHVSRLRSFARRFSGYLSVLLIGPVLIFAAIGITSTIMGLALVQRALAIEPLGALAFAASTALPLLFVVGVFTFAYYFVPNTRVHLDAALTGGAIAGVLWQTAAWAFAAFVSKSTHYAAIYSSFAILVLFLFWLYLNWLILLLGASVAFYLQHPEYIVPQHGEPRLSNRMRERVALMAMWLIGKTYREGGPACTFASLTRRLGVPMHALNTVLTALRSAGLLVETGDDPPGYLPARDPESITLQALLDTVRAAGEDEHLSPEALPAPPELEALLQRIDQAPGKLVQAVTLKTLVTGALRRDGEATPPST